MVLFEKLSSYFGFRLPFEPKFWRVLCKFANLASLTRVDHFTYI